MLSIDRPVLATACLRFPTASGAYDLKTALAAQNSGHGRPGPRRVNRLIQLAVLGARACVGRRALPADTAVYLSSRSAHVADTLLLLERIRDGLPASPVSFIHTAGNMAGYYIAADLGLHGSAQSLHSGQQPWTQLVEMAVLGARPEQHLLLGTADECVWPLDSHRQRHDLPDASPVEERSVFVLLGPRGAAGRPRLQSVRWEAEGTAPSTISPAVETSATDGGLVAPAAFVSWLERADDKRGAARADGTHRFIESDPGAPTGVLEISGR